MRLGIEILALFTTILLGTMAGFFFAFSNTVMPGFLETNPTSAIEGMQGINLVVRNPVFFVAFFLTPIFAVVAGVLAWMIGQRRAARLAGVAAAIYFAGVILVTVIHHIPLNEGLALLDARALGDQAAQVWRDYDTTWTPMNTVRAFAAAVAMVPMVFCVTRLRA